MLENSDIKKQVFKLLIEWNYAGEKANVYNIARKLDCSVSAVQAVLRVMSSEGLAQSSRGSWHLI